MMLLLFRSAGCLFMVVGYAGGYVGGLALHLVTVLLLLQADGFWAAVIGMSLPVFAQVYCILRLWRETGALFTPFFFWCLAYVGMWALIGIGGYMHTWADERERGTEALS